MSNRRCPNCGEEYSDTYSSCPFCEEEEAIRRGKPIRRRGGRRVEKRQPSGGAGGVMLLLTAVIILGVLGYVFFGDDVAEAVGIRNTVPDPVPNAGVQAPPEKTPDDQDQQEPPAQPSGGDDIVAPPTPPGEDGDSEEPDPPAEPEPLALDQSAITIPAGSTGRLNATGGSGEVAWTSSNPEIASVEGGAVTGKAGGTVTITATSGEETATCQVTVEGEPWVNPNAANISLNRTDFTLSSSSPTWQMKVKGTDSPVVWASNNTNVVTISDTGLVTRVGKGTTTITATVDGVTLECIVRVS